MILKPAFLGKITPVFLFMIIVLKAIVSMVG